MAEESRVPTAPIAHPSDRRDRLSSPASFSFVFCSFSLFLRLFESSPFFLLSARRRLSNTILEVSDSIISIYHLPQVLLDLLRKGETVGKLGYVSWGVS